MIGFFDEAENSRSMMRLQSFLGEIVGLTVYVAQEFKHTFIDSSFQVEHTTIIAFISLFLLSKVTQKIVETKTS